MAKPTFNLKLDIQNVLQILFVTFFGLAAVLFILFTIAQSEPHDFNVFYESARSALEGKTIYDAYGPYRLPYWYFPWLAWFYIPFASLPHSVAYYTYLVISVSCAIITINYLARVFVPAANTVERIFIVCMALILCWLLFRVGQMDFILLAISILMIYLIDKGKSHLAGFFTPLLLFKPHLYILFLPFALFKGKKGFFTTSTIMCLLLLAASFLAIPDWPQQMVAMLAKSGNRTDNNWNFTTLPNMLGMQENWSGTANLPFTLVLILTGFLVLWKFRELDTLPFLSLALTGSLFCAPRAYSYNFPLLIPAMVWVSSSLSKPFRLLFWLATGIVPFLFRFSTGTYSIVLVVFLLGIWKARMQQLDSSGVLRTPANR